MDGNYSIADLASIAGSNDLGGSNMVWLLLFFVLFGYGGFGFGGRAAANAAGEVASTDSIISSQRFDSLSKQINQIGDGLSSLGYSQLQQMDANTASINGNVTSEGRAIQSQISECCCSNQRNVDALRFDMANYAASINSNIDNKFAAIEKSNLESRLAEQAQQISQLQLQAAVCNVPRVNTFAYGSYPYAPVGCNCGNL